jgi:hypothetical protein
MSVQNPIISTPTQAKGVDAVILDLQTHLDTSLVWLSNGMGRTYRLSKVKSGNNLIYLPEVYLGGDRYRYFAATPDNDKKGQSLFFTDTSTFPNQQLGFYGIKEFDLSIIFSANLSLIDNTLLQTEDFTEHLIIDVQEALIRGLLGKFYKLSINEVLTDFEDVYAEFEVSKDRGIAHAPLTHFRFNCTIQVREDCANTSLDKCGAINQNISSTEKLECILPTYDFSQTITQDALTGQQKADLTSWLCTIAPTINESLYFGGVNSFVKSANSTVYDIERTDSFTWSVWAKLDNLTSTSCLISKGNGISGIILNVTANGAIRPGLFSNGFANGLGVTSLDGVVSFGDWHLFTITYDGTSLATGLKVYYDGVLIPTTTQVSNLNSTVLNVNNFRLGSQSGLAVPTQGRLFCFRQWDNVKSAAFVLQEYNEKGLVPSVDTPLSSCMIGTDSVYGEGGFCMRDEGNNGRIDGFSSYGVAPTDKTNDVPS